MGSYRLTEAMSFGALPVIISDGFGLPLEELIDWHSFALVIPEASVASIPNRLRSISADEIVSMRKAMRQVYSQYFASELQSLGGAIEIQRQRMRAMQSKCTSPSDISRRWHPKRHFHQRNKQSE